MPKPFVDLQISLFHGKLIDTSILYVQGLFETEKKRRLSNVFYITSLQVIQIRLHLMHFIDYLTDSII